MFWLLVAGTWHQNVCDVTLACHPGRIMGALNTESQSWLFAMTSSFIILSITVIEMSG